MATFYFPLNTCYNNGTNSYRCALQPFFDRCSSRALKLLLLWNHATEQHLRIDGLHWNPFGCIPYY